MDRPTISERELAEFLDEHPDWCPAMYSSLDTRTPLVFGVNSPNGHFFNFTELRKLLDAKPKA